MRLPAEKRVVRVVAVAAVATGAALPATMTVPARLPAVATGSTLLLYVERALAIFGVLVLALVFVYRAWHGQLPRSVSQRGAEWEDLASTTGAVVEDQIAELSQRVDDLQRAVEALAGKFSTIER